MPKISILTKQAPKPKGAYSQAIRSQNLLFIAGQLPIDLQSGQIAAQEASEQAKIVLEHVGAILEAAGLSYADVVKSEVFLSDIGDSKAVNEVYERFFKEDPKPARTTIEASQLPLGAKVEISCIAAFSDKDAE